MIIGSLLPFDRSLTLRASLLEPQRILHRGFVLQERQQIADARQAEPLHDRALSLVNKFVDVSRLQASRDHEFNQRQLSALAAVFDPAFFQSPLRTRNDDACVLLSGSPSQHGFAFTPLGRFIAALIGPHRQRVPFRRSFHHELGPHRPGQRLAIFHRDRRGEPQPSAAWQSLRDPAAPDDDVTFPHQELVRAGVEHPQRELSTAIVDVVQHRPVRLAQIFRREQFDIRRELDEAHIVARGQFQVDDRLIGRVLRIDCEEDFASQLLVRANAVKLSAFEIRLARFDFDSRDGSEQPRRRQEDDGGPQNKAG